MAHKARPNAQFFNSKVGGGGFISEGVYFRGGLFPIYDEVFFSVGVSFLNRCGKV